MWSSLQKKISHVHSASFAAANCTTPYKEKLHVPNNREREESMA